MISTAKSVASSGGSDKSKGSKDDSISDLSNYSFDLTPAEIAQIKRDYDRDPDRIADDQVFKEMALTELRAQQDMNRKMDNMNFDSQIEYLTERAEKLKE